MQYRNIINAIVGRVSAFRRISERKQAAENASYAEFREMHPPARRGK